MKRNKIRTSKERSEFFETHVLEFFDGSEQRVFEQLAYMQHGRRGNMYHRTKDSAHDIVMGGTLLVAWYEMDEIRKEHPGCIDGRLTNYNAWERYVQYCTLALTRIARRFEVTPDNIHEIAKHCLYEKKIDHHGSDLYIEKTPVSEFIVDRMKNKSLLSTFTDNIDGNVWYELPFCYKGDL